MQWHVTTNFEVPNANEANQQNFIFIFCPFMMKIFSDKKFHIGFELMIKSKRIF